MDDENHCIETLESLGYVVEMPRIITERQACLSNLMAGKSLMERKSLLASARKYCPHGMRGSEQRKAMLERLMGYAHSTPHVRKQIARIEAGL